MADTLHLSALRTQSLPFRIQEFTNHRILDIANKTLLKSIKDEAMQKGMPQRYINGIQSDFDGEHLWIWVDFKGKRLEPLDLFFEEGTKSHFIKPTKKKALAWVEAGAIGVVSAFRKFSKGHWVSGIEARHIFRDGFRKGFPEFKQKLQLELEQYLQESMLFG